MAAMVREDAMRDAGLGRFAAQLLINNKLDSHSNQDDILDTVFRYVQQITYIHDPGGAFDDINSARETLHKGYGDCDDLAVLLATLLALLGYTPAFVMAKYSEETNGFDHIYLEVETNKGAMVLDPTTRSHGIGWENPKFIDRVTFPIFGRDAALNALRGTFTFDLSSLINTGVQLGTGLLAASGQAKASQKQQEAARWAGHEQVMAAMNQIQAAIDSCQLTPSEGAAAARDVVNKFYAACDANFNSNTAKSCRNYGSEAGGFDAHIAKIGQGNLNCALTTPISLSAVGGSTSGAGGVGGASAAGSSSGSLGGQLLSLPVALGIGLVFVFLASRN